MPYYKDRIDQIRQEQALNPPHTKSAPKREAHPQAKLTTEKVRAIKELRERKGFKWDAIGNFFGVHGNTARRAGKGETWNG